MLLQAIGVGLSVAEGIDNARSARSMAKKQRKDLQVQIDRLLEQRDAVNEFAIARKENVTDMQGRQVGSLFDRVGMRLEAMAMQEQNAQAKTGMAASGTVSRASDLQKRGELASFESSLNQSWDRFKGEMLDIERTKQTDIAEIDMQREQIKGQIDVLKQQEKRKYLGIF